MLAIELVAAVHRDRLVPLVFADASGFPARVVVWQSVGGNGRRVHEDHRSAVRICFARREFQQVQRALDVHMMRRHRGELGPRRQQRGQMKNQVDLELREDALEDVRVEDGAGELPVHEPGNRRVERIHVEGYHLFVPLSKVGHEGMPDFAIRAGNEDDWFAHRRSTLLYVQTSYGIPIRFQVHRRL